MKLKDKVNCGIIVLFVLLIIIVTFPLAFKAASYIPGFSSTDEPYAALWNFWLRQFSFQNHISLAPNAVNYFIAFPWGRNMSVSGPVPSFLWNFYEPILKPLGCFPAYLLSD